MAGGRGWQSGQSLGGVSGPFWRRQHRSLVFWFCLHPTPLQRSYPAVVTSDNPRGAAGLLDHLDDAEEGNGDPERVVLWEPVAVHRAVEGL